MAEDTQRTNDPKLIEALPSMTDGKLTAFRRLYEKLEAPGMLEAIDHELTQRGLEIPSAQNTNGVVPFADPNAVLPERGVYVPEVETKMFAYISQRKHRELAAYLESVKSKQFSDAAFPYQLELISAYRTAQMIPQALVASKETIESPFYGKGIKRKANAEISEIRRDALTVSAYKAIDEADTSAALRYSTILEEEFPKAKQARDVRFDALFLVANNGVEQQNPTIVEEALFEMQAMEPHNPDVQFYVAELHRLRGEYLEAAETLADLKLAYNGGFYPYQEQLAYAYYAGGDLPEALEAFKEMEARGVDNATRSDIRSVMAEINAHQAGSIEAVSTLTSEDAGELLRSEFQFTSPLIDDSWRFRVWGKRTDVSLSSDSSIRNSKSTTEGYVEVEKLFGDFYAKLGGGGYDDGAMWGAAIGAEYKSGLQWNFAFEGNHLARVSTIGSSTEGVAFEALRPRQQRGVFSIQAPLKDKFLFEASAYARSVEIMDGFDMGDGYGFNLTFTWLIQEATADRPSIELAYEAEYHKFNPNLLSESVAERITGNLLDASERRALQDEFLSPIQHAHGVVLHLNGTLDDFYYSLATGLYYNVENSGLEAGVALEAGYQVTDRMRIYAAAEYFSGSIQSSGSGTFTGSLGMQITF